MAVTSSITSRERIRAPRMSDQRHHCRRGQSGSHRIGAAGEHDRHPRTEDDAGRIGTGQVAELFGQHVARLKVGHQQDVGLTGDGRANLLGLARPPS